jgi:hypothetical protein
MSTRRVFFKPEGVVRTARANHGRSNRFPLVTLFSQLAPRATDMSSAPIATFHVVCVVDPDCGNVFAA